jgi:hypothetical protein
MRLLSMLHHRDLQAACVHSRLRKARVVLRVNERLND